MEKPNILLITSDQQHHHTIGAFNPSIQTPNIDRLVHEGTAFTRAYCPNPTCTPTRASIITGMYPSQHGAWSLGTKLPEQIPTLGDHLQDHGYKTALVGKAHFQPTKSSTTYPSVEAYPVLEDFEFWASFNHHSTPWYGFEHVELLRNHADEPLIGQHYGLWLQNKMGDQWRQYFQKPAGHIPNRYEGQWELPLDCHYNHWIAERTNELIQQYHTEDSPFFIWASFPDPHPPYVAPEPYYSMYDPDTIDFTSPIDRVHEDKPPHYALTQDIHGDFSSYDESPASMNHGMHYHDYSEAKARRQKAIYYGMVTMMDTYIGSILHCLDNHQLTENTIVIFTTDHGHFMGHHGLMHKGPFMYEDLIRIPFIVRYPNHVPANQQSPTLQSLVDLAPTLLAMTSCPIPNIMTGINQMDVWLGLSPAVRDHIICEHHHEPTTIHLKTYVDDQYKITVYYNHTYGELYDLIKDPEELQNLWDDPRYGSLKESLLLKYIWAELGKEPMWMPRIARA